MSALTPAGFNSPERNRRWPPIRPEAECRSRGKGETAMIEFEPGGRGVEPRQVAFAGRQPGSMRHVPAAQFHHFQWHLLRVQGGLPRSMADLVSATLLPTSGVHPGATGRVITGFFVGLHMRGAAELREFLPRPDGDGHIQIAKAQVALSVESAWQGRGIGTALMAETLRTARRTRHRSTAPHLPCPQSPHAAPSGEVRGNDRLRGVRMLRRNRGAG